MNRNAYAFFDDSSPGRIPQERPDAVKHASLVTPPHILTMGPAVYLALLGIVLGLILTTAFPVRAAELRISKQYGINYLPLIVAEQQKSIEKKAGEAGIRDLKVQWVTLGGGAAANDALLSGSVDLIALGVPPFIRLWEKTGGKAKALAAFADFPPVLNSNNPAVKSIRDFTDKDRIALPAVKVSLQSLILQMAAAEEFGIENYEKYDNITVTAKHPDALIALVSRKSEITAHFTQDPFAFEELKHPGIHTVLDGYDVLKGRFTSQVLAGTEDFYTKNRVLADIVALALKEAVNWIEGNKEEAAKLYIASAKSKESVADLVAIINNPRVGYSSTPLKTMVFADFLYAVKAVKTKPSTWKDLFFPVVHAEQGS
ncbi:MAG: hypothetical protein LBQ51_07925 [Desulfovibrio sp.]|jgi:NitT/TauT family transport system substrate-binding protein|nr:hypothetical protein [Desulfovibrio sp.]